VADLYTDIFKETSVDLIDMTSYLANRKETHDIVTCLHSTNFDLSAQMQSERALDTNYKAPLCNLERRKEALA
jgi:hypothetical protein